MNRVKCLTVFGPPPPGSPPRDRLPHHFPAHRSPHRQNPIHHRTATRCRLIPGFDAWSYRSVSTGGVSELPVSRDRVRDEQPLFCKNLVTPSGLRSS